MRTHSVLCRWVLASVAAVSAMGAIARDAAACPFCSVESQTLTEETSAADAVVLAKLVKAAEPVATADEESDQVGVATDAAQFEILEVLRGGEGLKTGDKIDVIFFGPTDRDQVYLITGIGTEQVDWITPLPLSPAAVEYTRKLSGVAARGADRLAFFQEYFEHEDPLLAQDSYDEFARAPFADVQSLGPRMHHDKLVKWVADPSVSPSRRRLYLTMLSVCGSEADVPMLEEMIVSDIAAKQPFVDAMVRDGLALGGPIGMPAWVELVKLDERRKKLGLDALVACYLTLRGPEGLDLIDKQFLKNPHAEYTYIYSTVMALRFHADEGTGVLPKERLLESMRLLLDNADFADQIPIDLARWEDWSVLDRLVEMYKKSDKNAYIRPPVISYLLVASDQSGDVGERAKTALADLERLDPEGVKSARNLAAFGALARARGATADAAGESERTTGENGSAEGAEGDVGEGAEGNPAAKAASPKTESAGQGFGASAADVAAAEETDPADIPEPSEFEGEAKPQAELAREDEVRAVDGAKTQAELAQENKVGAGEAGINPQAELAREDKVQARDGGGSPHTELMIGLPLVAAALLMGVYWLILRYGAV